MLNNQIFITADNLSKYAAYLKAEERAAATIEKYIRDIRAFADFLDGLEITKELAILWKNKLKSTHEATSVNSMIAAINKFFIIFGLDIKVKPYKIQHQTFLPDKKDLSKDELSFEQLDDVAGGFISISIENFICPKQKEKAEAEVS